MRKHFHLGHIRSKESQVVVDEDAKFFFGVDFAGESCFETFDDASEAVVLD
jgi:hypothetical protein